MVFNMKKNPYSITGFTGNLSLVKKRKGEQYIYLNGRYIKNRLLNSAIFSAYHSLIQRGEFPFFVIFLEMPLNNYDVNVHPAKLEVRFINEWQVYHVIKSSITRVLQDILKVIPEYNKFQPFPSIPLHQTSSLNFDMSPSSSIVQYEQAPHNRGNHNGISVVDNNIMQVERANARMGVAFDDKSIQDSECDNIIILKKKSTFVTTLSGGMPETQGGKLGVLFASQKLH